MDTGSLLQPGRRLEYSETAEELVGTLEVPERPSISAGYADIYCGFWTKPQGERVQVAVKELKTLTPRDRQTEEEALRTKTDTRLKREVFVWSQTKHPNLHPFLGYCSKPKPRLISPWCSYGNLNDYLRTHPDLSRCDKLRFIYQTACGLHHLHSRIPPICHADIKPENILINDYHTATLSDFGLSRVVQDLEARSGFTTSETIKGTLRYMANELSTGEKPNLASDVYAFGGLILTVMSGKPPFNGLVHHVILRRVIQDQPPIPKDHPKLPLDDPLWKLMRRCWNYDPLARPTMGDVLLELSGQINNEESTSRSRPDLASVADDGANEYCNADLDIPGYPLSGVPPLPMYPDPSRGGAPAQLPPSGPSVVQPTPTQVAIAPNVNAIGVKRPSFGTRGSPILLYTNCFETTIPEGTIYHYTEFSPQARSKPLKMELFRKVQALSEFLQVSHGKKGVYNSDSQFFSTVSLGDNYQFQLQDGRNMYQVRLTQAATIDPQILVEYVQGRREREDHVTTVLTAVNVAIRMGLMEKFPSYNRNSFFIREAKVGGFKDRKYDGLEIWRGFFQSIRPVMGKMIINLDVSTGVVVKGGSLIAMALQFFKQPVNNVQFLANLNPRDKQLLERFLRGVKFVTNDAPDARPSAIKNLTTVSAEEYKFKKDDGKEISIAQYNQENGVHLRYPNLPCVEEIGRSRAVYPMEHCTIRAQLLPKLVESDQINDVLGFSTMKPHIHLQTIREGFQFLEYGQNEYLRDLGISIDPNPLRLQARVLTPPELQYSGKFERPQGGSWRTGKFFAAKEVKGWVIVNLSCNYPGPDVPRIAQDIRQSCIAQGMRWTNNSPISFARNPMSDPEVAIKEALAEHKKKGVDANLIFIIIPDQCADLYHRIKHFGDVKLGIATQCLKASKCVKSGRDYCASLSLKINAKLGGTNVVLKSTDVKFLSEQPVLILGADIMHSRTMGDEDLGRPSFAAVTGNIDMPGCRYVGVGRAQKTGQEMIQDLEGMVMQIIGEYKKANPGRKPFTNVLYFRDGVAENQFKTVIEEELPQIRSACAKSGIKADIKLTCVIVGKRHHYRLFLADASSADRTGYAPPGTVIDSVITSPSKFDFYLQPHAGHLGTSRPVQCNVLVDDNMFTPDDLQQLTFNLCHVYARTTRSVSLPAPVYYAHLVCSRANYRYDPKGNFSLDAPAPKSVSKEDAERRLQEYINAFMPLHPNTQSVMYFQ